MSDPVTRLEDALSALHEAESTLRVIDASESLTGPALPVYGPLRVRYHLDADVAWSEVVRVLDEHPYLERLMPEEEHRA